MIPWKPRVTFRKEYHEIYTCSFLNHLYPTYSSVKGNNKFGFALIRSKTILELSAQWPGLWMAARLEVTLFWYRPYCFCCVDQVCSDANLSHLHDKSREVCIKARSLPASLLFKGQVTEQTTVKWSIVTRLHRFSRALRRQYVHVSVHLEFWLVIWTVWFLEFSSTRVILITLEIAFGFTIVSW